MKIVLIEPLNIPQDILQDLARPLVEAGHDFQAYDDVAASPEDQYQRCKDADIVMLANHPLPKEVVGRLDKTQFINIAFTGVDHVAVDTASEKGIQVANASGYASNAVAELALGLALALYRDFRPGDREIRQGSDFTAPLTGWEIKGKTVGIVGTGAIGLATARLFKAFGAQLIGYNRTEKTEALDLGLEYMSLEDLLRQADIVTVHLPLTPDTKGLLSKDKLALMKETAILINVARGPVVDNAALADLLNAGQIAGAGIDVFDGEPPLPDDYPLLTAKNTLLTPHVGFLTQEAMILRAELVFKNTQAFIDGQASNLVNA